MLNKLLEQPRAFVYALLVHVALVGLLMLTLDWTPKVKPTAPAEQQPEVVEAKVIDESKVRAEMQQLEQMERLKRQQEQERLQRLKEQEEAAKKQRHAEEQRLAELKQQQQKEQQEAERQRKAQQEQARKEQEAERKRLAELQAQAQALEEKKRLEARRLAEIEAQRKLEEEQSQREQALREQLAAEQRAAAQAPQVNPSVINQYTDLIKQKVQRNWIKPSTWREGMSCVVNVSLIPGGDVKEVKVSQCGGDVLFERSVTNAVRKAAPLPLPPDPALFGSFRELRFIFSPKG